MNSNLNIVNLSLATKEDVEKRQIEQAILEGYEDPLLNDQKEILLINFNGKLYRRFIEGFGHIPHSQIFQKQVREEIVDVRYCKEELIPKITRDGLRCPAWVTNSGCNSYNIDHGHHRVWSHKQIHGSSAAMPCFFLSSEVYPILEDNSYGAPISTQFLYELSKITCNPPRQNKTYTFKDVPIHLRTLFSADPKFFGINPSGKFPNRETFDSIMDSIFPDAFLIKQTRTRIYNLWSNGKSSTKIKPVDYSDITNDLVEYGYDPGVTKTKSGKQSREKFLEWIDDKNSVYLGCGTTNASGATFVRDFCTPLIESMGSQSIGKQDRIHIVCHVTVYNPKPTLPKLNDQRSAFESLLRTWNSYFSVFGYPNVKFAKIIWPKQLTDTQDCSKIIDL